MADFKSILEKLKTRFTEHPHSIQESYSEHLQYACLIGIKMVVAGFACIIHAIFPFWLKATASNTIQSLHDELTARREKTNSEEI